jgi:hypothetical protein
LGFRPSGLSEALRSLGQLDRVTIKAYQSTVGSEAGQDFAGMPPIAEGAVDQGLSGLRFECLQDLRHQDGSVGSSRGLAGSDDPGDVRRVLLWGFLFVFLSETTRVAAGIADPAPVRGNLARRGDG